jgi:hydroxymethylglutaryl-CoA lyase
MAERIVINEVGLRDGLQNQPRILSTEAKISLFDSLASAGLRDFELTSFVSPKAVPQLADAREVLAAVKDRPGFRLTCLVPNMRGYERAKAAGAKGVAVVLATTETLNRKNINMSLAEATAVCEQVVHQAHHDEVFARAYIATAFACPFEGAVAPEIVLQIAARMTRAGADEIAIADTIGAAHPKEVRRLLDPLVREYGPDRIAAHFHDTRGLGSALAWAALEAGVRRFDGSIAGLGGCPFAPGASGNVATEDLVFLFDRAGFDTGVNLDKLIDAVGKANDLIGQAHGGRILPWYRTQRAKRAAVA